MFFFQVLEMHYVKHWMKQGYIHRQHHEHLLRIFFCYLHLGYRDDAEIFSENRAKCEGSGDEAMFEKIMLALYDWKEAAKRAENVSFPVFEESLAMSKPGSYAER